MNFKKVKIFAIAALSVLTFCAIFNANFSNAFFSTKTSSKVLLKKSTLPENVLVFSEIDVDEELNDSETNPISKRNFFSKTSLISTLFINCKLISYSFSRFNLNKTTKITNLSQLFYTKIIKLQI